MKNKAQPTRALIIIFMVMIGVVCLSPLVGPKNLSIANILDALRQGNSNTDSTIFFQLRCPRVLLSAMVGAVLAASGVVLQSLMRNPLATPFTVGISGGASLGAVLAIRFGWTAIGFGFVSPVTLSAFGGAVIVIALVYALAQKKYWLSTVTILLAGVTVNFFVSSLITFINFFSSFLDTRKILIWLMGGIDMVTYSEIGVILPFVVIGMILVLKYAPVLNILSVGPEAAQGLGVDIRKSQFILLGGTALMVASVVSLTGPIGFVGLIIPHVLRALMGPDHRLLLPASFCGGAIFLVICDAVARTLFAPLELPVGCITALCGGPFFMFLLWKKIRHQPFS